MPEYLKLNSRKLTYGEYWNIVRNPLVLIPWAAKLFGIRMKFGSGFAFYRQQREMEIAEQYFPPESRQKLQPLLDQCLAIGFHSPRFFFTETIQGETQSAVIALPHSSGRISARLFCTIARNPNVAPKINVLPVMLSELYDGRFLVTSTQKKRFNDTPGVLVNRLNGAAPERMLQSHEQQLGQLGLTDPARPIATAETLDDLWNRYECACTDFGLKRGIYTVMTPEEVTLAKQARMSFAPPPPPPVPPKRPPPVPMEYLN